MVAGFAFPDDGCFVFSGGVEMSVEAVVGDVGLSAVEPFVGGRVFFVEYGVPFFEPVEFAGDFAPEGVWVVDGFFIHLVVLFAGGDVCVCDEFLGGLELASFFEYVCDWLAHDGLLSDALVLLAPCSLLVVFIVHNVGGYGTVFWVGQGGIFDMMNRIYMMNIGEVDEGTAPPFWNFLSVWIS